MPFPLHKTPRGLLELFRLRTLGANPPLFGELVEPGIDVAEFYGADLQTVATQDSGPVALPTGLEGTALFPGRLLQMSAFVTMGAAAGTQVRLTLEYSPNPALTSVQIGFAVIDAPQAGATYTVVARLTRPIVFLPGAQFFAFVSGDAAGADHVLTRRDFFENYAPS